MKPPIYYLSHRDTLWLPFRREITDPLDPAALGWPARFRHVANLQVSSLEAAYVLTQHLDRAWWLNPGVVLHAESRSTSVGDVLVDAAGAAWAVAPLGFVQVAAKDHSSPAERGEDQGQKNRTSCSSQKIKPRGGQDVSR